MQSLSIIPFLRKLSYDVLQVHYLVDCHYSSSLERLWILGGTQHGSVGFFPLTYTGNGDTYVGPASAILDGGHCDVVRSVQTTNTCGSRFPSSVGFLHWSAAEDGRVCGWLDDGSLQLTY